MICRHPSILLLFLFYPLLLFAREKNGATIPWTTYEAEGMKTTGSLLGPKYEPYLVETESSGQRCVKLGAKAQYVEFTAAAIANSMIIRYSLPDNKEGNGLHSTLGIYKNGRFLQYANISSRHCLLYGTYPFTNNPDAGKPRNFYDEVSIKNLQIKKGDIIRIQLDCGTTDAQSCIIDLADLENIAPPLPAPANAISITDKQFVQSNSSGDYTEALRNCIAAAVKSGKAVWIPAGTYKITGDIVLPEGINIQGAGMWYSNFVGDDSLYADETKRVRFKGTGGHIHLSDFAIIGKLNYRSDREANDGITGSYGTGSTIARLWIEHTKVGMWIENSTRLHIDGCRLRNTIADGINFCVGMNQSVINNCTARNTGDDCFAIWPAVFATQQFSPAQNRIEHCTAQLPFLANGAAIYGGESNQLSHCTFIDISPGSAILISTTFPTESKSKNINNNFSGTTVIDNCDLHTSGGFDHTWNWRAAVEICLDKRNISGLQLRNLTIDKSLSNGLSIIANNEPGKTGTLSNTTLENVHVSTYGIGTGNSHGLYVSPGAQGSLNIIHCNIPEIKQAADSFIIHQSGE